MAADAKDTQNDDKKVVGLRTFADDVKRAREMSGDQTDAATPEPETAKPTEKIGAERDTPPEAPQPPPAPPAAETPEETSAPESDEPLEAPPFHDIRASSPEDTSFTDEESVEIADKEALKKETVRKTAPPQRADVPTRGVQFDTEGIPEQQASIHSGADGVFDTEEALEGGGGGTIVVDRKQERFHFFPSIWSAVKDWFGAKKEAFEESRKPKHVVKKADRRRDVIEAAARDSKRAPQDDFAQVSDRLRDVDRITTTDEVQIKDEEVAAPSWSHVQGDAPADTPPPAETSTKRTFSFAEEAEVPPPPTEEPESEPEPDTTADTSPTEEGATAPEPQEPEPLPATEPRRSPESGGFAEYRDKYGEDYSPREDAFGESLPPQPEDAPAEEPGTPRLQRQGVPEYRKQRAGQPRRETRPQGTPYLTMIAVVIAAVILGVGSTIWWFTRSTPTEVTESTTETPPLVEAQTSVDVPLGDGRAAFYTSLRGAVSRNAGTIVTFQPTVADVPASTERIFETLSLSAPGRMTRAVDQVTFGGLNGEIPFMVMHFSSFDTVFGGMLQWEGAMSADLAPLFGEATRTTSIDSRVNNRDIRVLIDPGGNDHIVYGFLDKNTLLITTNRNAYTTIAPKVQ